MLFIIIKIKAGYIAVSELLAGKSGVIEAVFHTLFASVIGIHAIPQADVAVIDTLVYLGNILRQLVFKLIAVRKIDAKLIVVTAAGKPACFTDKFVKAFAYLFNIILP